MAIEDRSHKIENCGNCRFASRQFNYQEHECRRHSPSCVMTGMQEYNQNLVFPRTKSFDWCGDFLPEEQLEV